MRCPSLQVAQFRENKKKGLQEVSASLLKTWLRGPATPMSAHVKSTSEFQSERSPPNRADTSAQSILDSSKETFTRYGLPSRVLTNAS